MPEQENIADPAPVNPLSKTPPSRKWVLVGILVFAVILLSAAGYAATTLGIFGSLDDFTQSTQTSQEKTTCVQSATDNKTSNWKTLETKKFIVKYPEDWQFQEGQLQSTLTKGSEKIVFYTFAGDHLPSVVANDIRINFAGKEVTAKERTPGMVDSRLGKAPNWTILAKIDSDCEATVVASSPSTPDTASNETILDIISSVRIKNLAETKPKTYENKTVGVSFQYPGGWYGIGDNQSTTATEESQIFLRETESRDDQGLELTVTKRASSLSTGQTTETMKIGNYEGVKWTIGQQSNAEVKKGDQYYLIKVSKYQDSLLPLRNEEIKQILDQVVSTFKFL